MIVSDDFVGLVPGRRYVTDVMPDGMWIRDGDAHPVARLPLLPGGEVCSATGCWRVEVERPRRRWMVVARELVSDEPVGCAYPRGFVDAFDLWAAPEREYRLREKLFSTTWILRGELGEIARLTAGTRGTIALSESVTPDPQLALVILLSYEAIRYDGQIPGVSSGGGG